MPTKYDFSVLEPEMLDFWEKNTILDKAREKTKDGKDFYFLDGPPYTSGQIHIGTAWNKSLKDAILRYKRMQGFNTYDRAGYDMHGLPTEHAVDKKLGLKFKEDIIKYGVDNYVKECRKLSTDNLKKMNTDFQRLGVWMDWDNAYQTISDDYINGEWWLIKQAHKNNRLYEDFRTMTWCASCETALAKHELEYKNVKDDSIFLKFKVKGKENEYIIIWTTTPWTIPLNLAVMVNPELDYVKAKVEDEVWIVAAQLVGPFVSGVANKQFKIIETFKGKELEGLKYEHPFWNEIKFFEENKDNEKLHSVILSAEYVDTTAGTGLVHCAPGCGPEDYEVGHREGLPPFNPLNEKGEFPEQMGKFADLIAKKDDQIFIQAMKDNGCLIESTEVEHDYAHCWRCHNPVIYRATKQWFFKVEDLKQQMIDANEEIQWVPKAAYNAFKSWLENLRDNSITKQRFWGCPIPIWKCEKCEEYEVIGSIDELKEKAGELPEDLHKPFIDEIVWPCKCGSQMQRIPDILDVWVDAGCASWNDLYYPKRTDLFEKLFPADFILEGKDQIRGWFNLLMVASMVAMDKPSFKACYMHGYIQDAQGRKMSKSLGNYISPKEVVDQYGADAFRYFCIGNSIPAVDLNYNFEDVKLKAKYLSILWNVHNFVIDLAKNMDMNPTNIKETKQEIEERYIISKMHSTIAKATEAFDDFLLDEPPKIIEDLFLELSRTYMQFTRDKSSLGSDIEKQTVLDTIYTVLIQTIKILHPICPFITEKIYQDLKAEFGLEQESIALLGWPEPDKNLIDEKLESDIEMVNTIAQAILFAREKIQMGVRWPLSKVTVHSNVKQVKEVVDQLGDIIKKHTNIKEIEVRSSLDYVKTTIKGDMKQIGPDFGNKAPKIMAKIEESDPEVILKELSAKSKHEISIDDENIDIVKEHLIIQRKYPVNLQEIEFPYGILYLDKTMTPELEAEGLAREIMRRIQALRKKAGLQKQDRIECFIKSDKELAEMIKPHEDQIKEKVGAENITIAESDPGVKFEHHSEEKVKDRSFEIHLSKL